MLKGREGTYVLLGNHGSIYQNFSHDFIACEMTCNGLGIP